MSTHIEKDRTSGTSSENNAAQGSNTQTTKQTTKDVPPQNIVTGDTVIPYVTAEGGIKNTILKEGRENLANLITHEVIPLSESDAAGYNRETLLKTNKEQSSYFIFGQFAPLKRANNNAKNRTAITLDLDEYKSDNARPLPFFNEMVNHLKSKLKGVGFGIYTTFSSTLKRPKYRVIIPLDKPVAPDEYKRIAQRVTHMVGDDMVDPASYVVAQAMYAPRCFLFNQHEHNSKVVEGRHLDATTLKGVEVQKEEAVIAAVSEPKAITLYNKEEIKQNKKKYNPKPLERAFLAIYPFINQARDKYLSDILLATDNPNRYTYYKATENKGGINVFDGGRLIQSHHAVTDPNHGKTYNSYKAVMHYKFEGSNVEKHNKIKKLLKDDAAVQSELEKINKEELRVDFGGDLEILHLLKLDRGGRSIKESIDNINVILENDPNLKDKIIFNKLSYQKEVKWKEGWVTKNKKKWRKFTNADEDTITSYINKTYDIGKPDFVKRALRIHFGRYSYDPVKKFIKGLKWDGVKRLETLFIDYFKADDDPYTRDLARVLVMGIIQRNLRPGSQFEYIPILISDRQGIGKGQFLRALSFGWFTDSLGSFSDTKLLAERIAGNVIGEIGEMAVANKSSIEAVKMVASMQEDNYRKAYDPEETYRKRRIVFVGTSNKLAVLRDDTGNRRFLPLKLRSEELEDNKKLSVFIKADKGGGVKVTKKGKYFFEQLWAEGKHLLIKEGKSTLLNKKAKKIARDRQKLFSVKAQDPRRGIVTAYLDEPYTETFGVKSKIGIVKNEVCVAEIAALALGAKKGQDREFNAAANFARSVMESLDTWERGGKSTRFGIFGVQRVWFKRKAGADKSEKEGAANLEL